MEPFGFDNPIKNMARGYVSLFLVLALAFSSVGFTITETVCPKNLTKEQMAKCAKCKSPRDLKCCKEIVKRAALVTEFERVTTANAKASLPVVLLSLDQSLQSLAGADWSIDPDTQRSDQHPPGPTSLQSCVRTTVILI